jgi:hypothetical protein
MKMMLLFLLASSAVAFARIGETAEQLEKRYGKPMRITVEGSFFEKDGISIQVVMWKDRCHLIYFSPAVSEQDLAQHFGRNPRKLTKAQIQSCLADNPVGVKWDGTEGTLSSRDHKYTALATPNGVVIQTVAFLNHSPKGSAPIGG